MCVMLYIRGKPSSKHLHGIHDLFFQMLFSLEVAQIYLPWWGGVGGLGWVGCFSVIIMQVSFQIGLNWNYIWN